MKVFELSVIAQAVVLHQPHVGPKLGFSFCAHVSLLTSAEVIPFVLRLVTT